MDSDFRKTVEEQYTNLHSKSEHENFELSDEIQDGVTARFVGKRSDATYWGDKRYSVDFGVKLEIYDDVDWNEVEIEKFEDNAQDMLEQTVGYSGPVVLRKNSSPMVIEWSRRMIFMLDDEE
jgi:hypothetical protein